MSLSFGKLCKVILLGRKRSQAAQSMVQSKEANADMNHRGKFLPSKCLHEKGKWVERRKANKRFLSLE